jgi:hypothetical protein
VPARPAGDPVRLHIARVDLSRVLIFLGEAEPSTPATAHFARCLSDRATPADLRSDFSAAGWNVSEFLEFRSYCELADTLAGPPATLASTMPAPHVSGGE